MNIHVKLLNNANLMHLSRVSRTNFGLGISGSIVRQSFQSSQLHLNWKLLRWQENQLENLQHSKPISELQSVTCHMGSHSVTCHPTQVNTMCLNHSQTDRYSIYLPQRDERL